MCVTYVSHFSGCDHRMPLLNLDGVEGGERCRVCVFTGYCFSRRVEVERVVGGVCPGCEGVKRLGVGLGLGGIDVDVDGDGDGDGEKGVGGEGEVGVDGFGLGLADGYVEAGYRGRGVSRHARRRRMRGELGEWEIVERGEVEGFDEFTRMWGSPVMEGGGGGGGGGDGDADGDADTTTEPPHQTTAPNNEDVIGDDGEHETGIKHREQKGKQRVTWFNGVDGEVSAVKEFEYHDRPRLIAGTEGDGWARSRIS